MHTSHVWTQIDPNVIAFVACLQEVQRSWDEVTAGAPMSSGAYTPALIAALAQLICKVLHQKDSAYLPTAALQVIWRQARVMLCLHCACHCHLLVNPAMFLPLNNT